MACQLTRETCKKCMKLDTWKPNASSKYKTLKKLLSHVNLGFINALADWGRSRFTSKYIITIFWVSVSRKQTFKGPFSLNSSGQQLHQSAEARPSEIHLQREGFFLAERRRHVAGSLKPSLGPGKTFKPSKSHIAEQFEESAIPNQPKVFWLFLENLQMSNQNNFSTLHEASKLGSSTGHGRSDVGGEATFVALTSCGLRYTTSSTAQVVFV